MIILTLTLPLIPLINSEGKTLPSKGLRFPLSYTLISTRLLMNLKKHGDHTCPSKNSVNDRRDGLLNAHSRGTSAEEERGLSRLFITTLNLTASMYDLKTPCLWCLLCDHPSAVTHAFTYRGWRRSVACAHQISSK